MIHGFLGKTTDANESFERLLAGESIECLIDEDLPYHRIYENGDNLWSALLETGYLTKTKRLKTFSKFKSRRILRLLFYVTQIGSGS